MSFEPVNGAPMTILLGIDDNSKKKPIFELPPRPIHYPLVFLYAEYGDDKLQACSGNTKAIQYGDKTFDLRSKFANHATAWCNMFMQKANPVMIKRILPDDIGEKANVRLWVEVVEEQHDEIEREVDGSFKIGPSDQYVTTGSQVDGYTLKFGYDVIAPKSNASQVGKGTVEAGTLTNKSSTASKRYPLVDFEVHHYGSKGNTYGFKIWAPTTADRRPLNEKIMEQDNVYPFMLSLVERPDPLISPKGFANFYGSYYSDFTLKPNVVTRSTAKEISLEDVVLGEYQDLQPPEGQPIITGPFARVHVYDENIATLLKQFAEKEKLSSYNGNEFEDLDLDSDDQLFYKFNLFGLTTSDNKPYQTIRFASGPDAGVRLTERTAIFAGGASDGTMSDDVFAAKVKAILDEFDDPNSRWQDPVSGPFSAFWDSGFPMETKYSMGKFIAQRKNTMVFINTHIHGEAQLSASEESSRGVALVERLRTYSESDFFNTKTVRGVVGTRSGRVLGSTWKHFVPVNYSFAGKWAEFAGRPKFDVNKRPDVEGNNVIKDLRDINYPWVPGRVRNQDWAAGLMWPEGFTERTCYFPAPRTVYDDDTSILTSIINAAICAEAEYVGDMARRVVSGAVITQQELETTVVDFVTKNLAGKFADMVFIRPEVEFTVADESRGYSWHLNIHIWGNQMRTVQIVKITTHDVKFLDPNEKGFVA